LLKILLPERQTNKKIYNLFNHLLNNLFLKDWIKLYIFWELSLVKELGYEINLFEKAINSTDDASSIKINNKFFNLPKLLLESNSVNLTDNNIKEALMFNKNLLLENFATPNNLKLPIARNILESYYS